TDCHEAKVQDESKFRFVRLCLLQRSDHAHNIFRDRFPIRPINKDSVAKVLVHGTAVLFDNLLAHGEPGTDQCRKFIARKLSTERCEIDDVSNEQPAGNIFDSLLQSQWRRGAFRSVGRIERLPKNKRAAADCDPVAVTQSSRLVNAALIQKSAVTAAQVNEPEYAATF